MKNNKLLNAMGTIDERHIREDELADIAKLEDPGALKKRKPIKMRAMLIAAAAVAALAAVVGFSPKTGNGRNTIIIGDNEAAIALDLRAKNIIIPEKYLVTSNFYGRQMEMTPSELVAEFGVEPLGIHNDNFSEEIDFEPNPVRDGKTGELLWTYNGEPQLQIDDQCVEFHYYLQSKSLGRHINITAQYITDNRYSSSSNIGTYKGMLYEIIKLNNGTQCYVDKDSARFAYDGVKYKIGLWDYTREGGSENSLDDTLQILRDLGVLK